MGMTPHNSSNTLEHWKHKRLIHFQNLLEDWVLHDKIVSYQQYMLLKKVEDSLLNLQILRVHIHDLKSNQSASLKQSPTSSLSNMIHSSILLNNIFHQFSNNRMLVRLDEVHV